MVSAMCLHLTGILCSSPKTLNNSRVPIIQHRIRDSD